MEIKTQNGSVELEIMSYLIDISIRRLNLLNQKATHLSCNHLTPILLIIFSLKEVGKFNFFHIFIYNTKM